MQGHVAKDKKSCRCLTGSLGGDFLVSFFFFSLFRSSLSTNLQSALCSLTGRLQLVEARRQGMESRHIGGAIDGIREELLLLLDGSRWRDGGARTAFLSQRRARARLFSARDGGIACLDSLFSTPASPAASLSFCRPLFCLAPLLCLARLQGRLRREATTVERRMSSSSSSSSTTSTTTTTTTHAHDTHDGPWPSAAPAARRAHIPPPPPWPTGPSSRWSSSRPS